MANEVKGIFIMDASQAFKTADALELRYRRIETMASKLGGPSTAASIAGPSDFARDFQERVRLERSFTAFLAGESRKREEIALGAIRRVSSAGNRAANAGGSGSAGPVTREGTSSAGGRAVGLAAGAVIGDVIGRGVGAFINYARQSIDIAVEHERALRVLSGSAVDAGVSFQFAAAKNTEFAAKMAVSKEQAVELTGNILELASASGKMKDVDNLFKSVTDIGASKGLSGSQISGIVDAISNGNLQAVRKLGIPDLQNQMRDYARAINVPVSELTKFEKAQIAANAIMAEAPKFAGANEAKLNSLGGSIANVKAQYDDMTTAAAVSFSQSSILGDGIKTLSGLFQGLSGDIDKVNKLLGEGKSPKEVAEATYGVGLGDYIKGSATGLLLAANPLAALFLGKDTISGALNPRERSMQEYADKIASEKRLRDQQDAQAKESAKNNEAEKKREEDERKERTRINKVLQEYNDLLGGSRTTLKQLRDLQARAPREIPEEKLADVLKRVNAAIEADVAKARDKVKDLHKQYEGVFDTLHRNAGSSNPFVAVLRDADKAMSTLRENTRGLSGDLRKSFEDMQRQQNALNLFNVRIDTALQAFDLREQAKSIREGSADPARGDQFAVSGISRFLANQATGLFRNPENLRKFFASDLSAGGRLALHDTIAQQEEAGGLFRNPEIQARQREALAREAADDSASNRLDKQIEIVRKFKPENDEERAAADKKIIALTAGQLDLTDRQREEAASAREREAERLERAEADAIKREGDRLIALQAIQANTEALLKKADSGGVSEIELTIKDETDGMATVTKQPKRPGPEDVRRTYFDEAEGN